MNSQLIVGWLAILVPLFATTTIVALSVRSARGRAVNYRRVLSGFAFGTAAFYAMIWLITMFIWVFAILIDFEWLPDRYFVWLFESLTAPWRFLLSLAT